MRETFKEDAGEESSKVSLLISSYVRVDSRKDFVLWMCNLHNSVNRTLLKPVYPCNYDLLEERWHTGCSECWNPEGKKKMTSTESMELEWRSLVMCSCKDMKKFGLS